MNPAIAWLVRNPVAANLLMLWLAAVGLWAASNVRREVMPEVSLGRVGVSVAYPGAAPEDVENGVVTRIEEAIEGIDGIRQIRSTAAEGSAIVLADLELSADARSVAEDIKNRVDAISTFPAEAERPVVRELIGQNQVVDVVVSGTADLAVLRALAEQVRDGLNALPEVGRAQIVGAPPPEISIEVSEADLRRYDLTFGDVVAAVRAGSLDLPGGRVLSEREEILLRTVGQAYAGDDYGDITLRVRDDGGRLLLGDVAMVVDGFAETDQHTRFDGEPAVIVSVFQTGRLNATEISAAVRRYVEDAGRSLPESISLTVWRDEAEVLDDSLSLMLGNAAMGFALVLLMLGLFLEPRPAFWVTCGILIAFLGAIATMPALGASINTVSIFAFVLVLGIVVDDAIIVAENIHRHQGEGGDAARGAVEGAREIAKPVTFAVLTSVAAFLPLLGVPGIAGQILRSVPLVAIPCLLFSLIESLGILPAHLAHGRGRGREGLGRRIRRKVDLGLRWFVRTCYLPALEAVLRQRAVAVATALSLLALTLAMVFGGVAPLRFFITFERNHLTASLTMPPGTPADVTSAALARIETGAERLRERLAAESGIDYVRHVATSIGDQPVRSRAGGDIGPVVDVAAPHVGEVSLELAPAETRDYSTEELGFMWRDATPPIPEAEELSFDVAALSPGSDIDVRFAGPDLDDLGAAASAVAGRLAAIAGTFDIAVSSREGKREVRLRIREGAEALGLSVRDLGRQVRGAFHGEEAQRIQRGRDDVRVVVRYPRDERRSLGSLERMRIRTPDGGAVPLGQVAHLESGRAYPTITRVDRNRSVRVTAELDTDLSSFGSVVAELEDRILPEVLAAHPGITYSFGGVQEVQQDTVESLRVGFLAALLLIFTLLAISLRSYIQPLIIMAAIPFGLVGAVWGHLVMSVDLTTASVFGFIALSGVVVNDSLVMVDFINKQRSGAGGAGEGAGARADGLQRAIRAAGQVRFRPIMLTSTTTFVGLAPLVFDGSSQAGFLVPMAVSLAFGVLFATLITLILVPVAYSLLEDARRWTSGHTRG